MIAVRVLPRTERVHLPDQGQGASLAQDMRRTLQLLAMGLSSREVAAQLGCPVEVAHEQLASTIGQLGATSKLDAILKAARLGLIDLSGPM